MNEIHRHLAAGCPAPHAGLLGIERHGLGAYDTRITATGGENHQAENDPGQNPLHEPSFARAQWCAGTSSRIFFLAFRPSIVYHQ
jgi:hypothetical protein